MICDILIRRCLVFLLCLISYTNIVFSQDEPIRIEIDRLIHFKPINDTLNGIYYSYDISYDNSAKKRILVVIFKQDSIAMYGQILMIHKKNGTLKIIDSSKVYERDGMGPQVYFLTDTLLIEHCYHQGCYRLYYKFNLFKRKYSLVEIEMNNVLHEIKKYNNFPTGEETQTYNVNRQVLRINKFNNDDKLVRSEKIKKKLPKNIVADLVHFIDPIENYNYYSKIWKKKY